MFFGSDTTARNFVISFVVVEEEDKKKKKKMLLFSSYLTIAFIYLSIMDHSHSNAAI